MNKKQYSWNKFLWKKTVLTPRAAGHSLKKRRARKERFARWIQEDGEQCRIRMPEDAGKITDAGYDVLSCVYAKIHPRYDFTIEADITVRQFLHEPGPNNQEGFGLFFRETMKKHPTFGLHYSNMAAIGGYYGRFNYFGRSGIAHGDISHVENFFMYRKADRPGGVFEQAPLHYKIAADRPRLLHLMLSRQGGEVYARMTGQDGEDLLDPDKNGGAGEMSDLAASAGEPGTYKIRMNNAFPPRHNSPLYIGFFAARGTEITVHKDSFVCTVLGRQKQSLPGVDIIPAKPGAVKPPQKKFNERDYASEVKKIYYASPDGKPSGNGSIIKPYDIYTAIERCGDSEQILLKPGRYELRKSVIIEKRNSGEAGRIRKLSGAADGTSVIDFGGTNSSLLLLGDYWVLENIRITNGYGIQIEGSFNWLRKCSSFRNCESGFQIKHHENASDPRGWPCCNLIEDCSSYENRDRSECSADGFACKVAAGAGNVFKNCISFLNADDGFDLFSKNRPIGAVTLINCRSCLNGYKLNRENKLEETKGNGSGYKLGGERNAHRTYRCPLHSGRKQTIRFHEQLKPIHAA